MNNKKIEFTRNMEYAYRWFYEFQTASQAVQGFPANVWHKLYSRKNNPKHIKSLDDIDLKKKTALILLGPSGCGKTSYAKELRNRYSLELISFDQIEMRLLYESINGDKVIMMNVDSAAVSKFGELLAEKSNKNLVIDMQAMYMNTRGALLRTLRSFGYEEIVVVSFLKIPRSEIDSRLRARALEETYFELYAKTHTPIEFAEHRLQLMGERTEELICSYKSKEEWRKEPAYRKNLRELEKSFYEEEPNDTDLVAQMYYGLFEYGVDLWFDLY